ncbi:ABC transporter ATP-binding protein [Microlunatus panaciterrae]|uniref:ABC-2 type transport system ATP-binding protein n=1 Tax=Microlunatus panaciterrae TaxID=400768 RepID=A0ABS2RI52_9ACTN|nr:ABC-2 type transport system ATP-binding protein [Microlunatus panaciterrae]
MTTTVVQTTGLSKSYGPTRALRDVSLSIERGEVFGYLGPNGAGKTTTLRLLMGMIHPSAGSAVVLGLDAWRDSVKVHRLVGYLSGEPALYDRLTGRQHISFVSRLRGRGGDRKAGGLADRLHLDLQTRARSLSKGNRQKLALLLALMSAPQLLILDEPTSGLDPIVQKEVLALLAEHTAGGGSVLLSSHLLAEVQQVADRIGVIRSGELIAVESLEALRGRSLHHVSALFSSAVAAASFARLPGVRDLQVTDHSLTCSAPQSALDALLKQVAQHDVVDFRCAEADLEETFLAYYGTGDHHAG